MATQTTTAQPPTPGHDRDARPVALTCGGCSKTYGEAAWRALPVSERIGAPEVRRVLSKWPDGLVVEVRRCGCGRTIAAKRSRE